MSGPVLVHALESAPFDIAGFVRAELPGRNVILIAEVPPDRENPLEAVVDYGASGRPFRSELFSHPRKEGWGLFVLMSAD